MNKEIVEDHSAIYMSGQRAAFAHSALTMTIQAMATSDTTVAASSAAAVNFMLDALTETELTVYTGNGVKFENDLMASPQLVRARPDYSSNPAAAPHCDVSFAETVDADRWLSELV